MSIIVDENAKGEIEISMNALSLEDKETKERGAIEAQEYNEN